jgi:hypothetical protein
MRFTKRQIPVLTDTRLDKLLLLSVDQKGLQLLLLHKNLPYTNLRSEYAEGL